MVATFYLAVLAAGGALAQGAPSLALPIACAIGDSCIVQSYVDRDPGEGALDYRCGHLTYDGHKGTDIRVIDLGAIAVGAIDVGITGRQR